MHCSMGEETWNLMFGLWSETLPNCSTNAMLPNEYQSQLLFTLNVWNTAHLGISCTAAAQHSAARATRMPVGNALPLMRTGPREKE